MGGDLCSKQKGEEIENTEGLFPLIFDYLFLFLFLFFNRCVKIATKLFVSCRCFRAGVDDGGSDDWGERGARGGGGGGSNKRKEMSVLSTYRPFIHDSLFLVDW